MTPKLSVVVAGSRPEGPPPELHRVLGPLARAGELEVIIATARADPEEARGYARVVPCAPGTTIPAMRLAGVRAAVGPRVAVTEDFCAPAEGWAEALLQARARTDAAVLGGPVTRSGGSAADWALTFVEYGRFFRREPEGSVEDLSSINAAYDAARLRSALGEDATELYEVEVHAKLRTGGARFWRVPGAVMRDENHRSFAQAVRGQFHHGRFFGGGRVEGRGPGARLLRAALAPAVPAVLFGRIVREASAAGHLPQVVRAMPALAVLLAAWAAGEATGSLAGAGDSGSRWT